MAVGTSGSASASDLEIITDWWDGQSIPSPLDVAPLDVIDPTHLRVYARWQPSTLERGLGLVARWRRLAPAASIATALFVQRWNEQESEICHLLAHDAGLTLQDARSILVECLSAVADPSCAEGVRNARSITLLRLDAASALQTFLSNLEPWLAGYGALILCPTPALARVAVRLAQLLAGFDPHRIAVWSAQAQDLQALSLEHPEFHLRQRGLEAPRNAVVHHQGATGGLTQEWVRVGSDVALEEAVDWVVRRRCQFAGQYPAGAHVVFVEVAQLPAWIEALHWRLAELVFGDPTLSDTDVGPVVDKAVIKKTEDQVPRAILKRMGRLVMGARQFRPMGLPGYFFQPTLLAEVSAESPAVQKPMAGPVLIVNALEQWPSWVQAHSDPTSVMVGSIGLASVTDHAPERAFGVHWTRQR